MNPTDRTPERISFKTDISDARAQGTVIERDAENDPIFSVLELRLGAPVGSRYLAIQEDSAYEAGYRISLHDTQLAETHTNELQGILGNKIREFCTAAMKTAWDPANKDLQFENREKNIEDGTAHRNNLVRSGKRPVGQLPPSDELTALGTQAAAGPSGSQPTNVPTEPKQAATQQSSGFGQSSDTTLRGSLSGRADHVGEAASPQRADASSSIQDGSPPAIVLTEPEQATTQQLSELPQGTPLWIAASGKAYYVASDKKSYFVASPTSVQDGSLPANAPTPPVQAAPQQASRFGLHPDTPLWVGPSGQAFYVAADGSSYDVAASSSAQGGSLPTNVPPPPEPPATQQTSGFGQSQDTPLRRDASYHVAHPVPPWGVSLSSVPGGMRQLSQGGRGQERAQPGSSTTLPDPRAGSQRSRFDRLGGRGDR